MRALVVGQGGREHALVRALALSSHIDQVHVVPGSDGLALDSKCHPEVDWKNTPALLKVIADNKIDFVVIGPEVPLVDGLADRLRAAGVRVVGPSGEAARLEGSKIFCKEFLLSAKVPTARSQVVATVEEALNAASHYRTPYVLKADGLAAGKGVFICKTIDELREAAHSIFVDKSLGSAGAQALVEEFQPGFEVSYLVLTDGESFEPLPFAQDHKRLGDGDVGPNTGGMGVVAPVAMEEALRQRIDREVIVPTLREMRRRGFVYRGVLFVGLMMTPEGPSVLEFNTRFGDPETQVIVPLLDGDWAEVFSELADGRLPHLKWLPLSSACIVVAAAGYPDAPVKGARIENLKASPSVRGATRYLLHAGTQKRDGLWQTAGGRVLNAVGLGHSLAEAVSRAYEEARTVAWPGAQMRKDIGAKLL